MNEHPRRDGWYPFLLMVAFIGIWTAASIDAVEPELFLWETVAVFALLLILFVNYSQLRLSALSWTLLFVYLCLHALGTHYTYEVPTDLLGPLSFFPYDKLIHFLFGLLLYYPFKESCDVHVTKRALRYLTPLFIILAISALYELWEWIFTVSSPRLGLIYSAYGNDFWDTQKDIAYSLAGGLIAMGITAWFRRSPARKNKGI